MTILVFFKGDRYHLGVPQLGVPLTGSAMLGHLDSNTFLDPDKEDVPVYTCPIDGKMRCYQTSDKGQVYNNLMYTDDEMQHVIDSFFWR